MTTLPPPFLELLQAQLGSEFPVFQEALESAPVSSIRVNGLKEFTWEEKDEKVKWNSGGVYLPDRPVFTLDPLLHAGAYYVQEASSMFLEEAVKQTTDLDKPLKVLDLCAAPGGKTTLLASLINRDSILVANEVIRSRVRILEENVIKWGAPNVVITNNDPKDFAPFEGYFDLVLVDAPCSGEGMFRKNMKAMEEWSLSMVDICTARQKRILAEAVKLLKPGGILIYCTCTFNDFENMDNAEWLCREFPLESLPLKIPVDWGIVGKFREKVVGYQFYPHRLKGEGFFISCFRKEATSSLHGRHFSKQKLPFPHLRKLHKKKKGMIRQWVSHPEEYSFWTNSKEEVFAIPENMLEEIIRVRAHLTVYWDVFLTGTIKNNQFIPAHPLALHTRLITRNQPCLELDRNQAIAYLKKEYFPIQPKEQGWTLITYRDYPLGWIKALPKRVNNYYPKEWRIRMENPLS